MKIKFFGIILLLLLIFSGEAFSQTAAADAKTDLPQRLQERLDDFHKNGKFAGATLGVCLADGKCFGLATGFSDSETKRRMQPDDLLMAGSVGKTYAAALAMQLVKEGKINLDDKIEKYFGQEKWFSRLPNSKDITIRQLMNHTSGLVRYEFKETFAKDLAANPYKVWKPEELIAYLFDEKATFEAGKGWDYSDTNYIVLGMIIEQVTGKKFYDLAKSRIIKPHNFKRTIPQDRRDIQGLVQGYAGDKNPFGKFDLTIKDGKYAVNPQFEWTGGGWVTTSEDLARWAKTMYEGKAFDASLLPQMLDGVPAPMLGKDVKYGLGAIIRPTIAGISYGHSGFFPGYRADMMYFPDHKISIAVQMNSSAAGVLGKPLSVFLAETAQEISGTSNDQNAVVEKLKKQMQELLDAIAPGKKEVWDKYLLDGAIYTDEEGRVLTKDELLKELTPLPAGYIGTIKMGEPKVSFQQDVVVLSHRDREELDLYGQKIVTFFHFTGTWARQKDGSWKLAGMMVNAIPNERQPAKIADYKILDDYVGEYRVSPEVSYTITREGDQLFGQRTGRAKEELLPLCSDIFYRKGVWRGEKVFERDAAGKIINLRDRRENNDLVWKKMN